MKIMLQTVFVACWLCSVAFCDDGHESDANKTEKSKISFADPVRVEAGGELIATETPGYASPCMADLDGDGLKDLLVGQFNGGKIMRYKNQGDGKFAAGEFLQADGGTAEVPGVW